MIFVELLYRMSNRNNIRTRYNDNFTNWIYIWLVAVIIFTIIVILIGHYNFPLCLLVTLSPNKSFDIKDFTPAYPPPLIAFT